MSFGVPFGLLAGWAGNSNSSNFPGYLSESDSSEEMKPRTIFKLTLSFLTKTKKKIPFFTFCSSVYVLSRRIQRDFITFLEGCKNQRIFCREVERSWRHSGPLHRHEHSECLRSRFLDLGILRHYLVQSEGRLTRLFCYLCVQYLILYT